MLLETELYKLDIDVERTRQFYESAPYDACQCAGCRNFCRAYQTLPAHVPDFFQRLGIRLDCPPT